MAKIFNELSEIQIGYKLHHDFIDKLVTKSENV